MYLYLINKPSNEQSVAELECFMLTGVRTSKNYALSETYVDLSRSAYIDTCIFIYFMEDTKGSLYHRIKSLDYKNDKFKVKYLNIGSHIDFNIRKEIEREISDIFPGTPDLTSPDTEFVATVIDRKWIFGKIAGKAENRWHIYNNKPCTFCNALSSRIARALVNIGAGNRTDIKLLDPCCGVGTVLLEALDMGIDAYGYDINNNVVRNANKNLNYFKFDSRVECKDAVTIKGSYDVSIVDLPYGLLSKKGSDRYPEILKNVRAVSSHSVILSSRDISDIINDSGFKILENCKTHKGKLDRHIIVCE